MFVICSIKLHENFGKRQFYEKLYENFGKKKIKIPRCVFGLNRIAKRWQIEEHILIYRISYGPSLDVSAPLCFIVIES